MQVVIVAKVNSHSIEEFHAFNGDGHSDVAKAEAKFKELGKEMYPKFDDDDWASCIENGLIAKEGTRIEISWSTNQIKTLAVYGEARRT